MAWVTGEISADNTLHRNIYDSPHVVRHLSGQVPCLADNDEVWSDKLSDQRIRREPNGLSYICLVDCESQINYVYGRTSMTENYNCLCYAYKMLVRVNH